MDHLVFHSDILKETDRYSKGFWLPDYLYDQEGKMDREAMLNVLLSEEYGYVREEELTTHYEIESEREKNHLYAGKCRKHIRLRFFMQRLGKVASFPVDVFLPVARDSDVPLIVALDFPLTIDRCFCPIEELMDRGVAIARVDFTEITSDDDDLENGAAGLWTDRTDDRAPGKLAIWAYAARLIGHAMIEQRLVRPDMLYVSGHSRLGKTALLAAAQDTVFAGVLANNSGCSGAAISRETTGENIARICKNFGFFFNRRYPTYADREHEMPFDQHYLLALIAPRKLCVITGELDIWADTEAQYLACEAASVAYEKMGVVGLDRTKGLLRVGEQSTAGNIAFSRRPGPHYLGRDDWHFFIDFIKGKGR